jgi:hypothetical protein
MLADKKQSEQQTGVALVVKFLFCLPYLEGRSRFHVLGPLDKDSMTDDVRPANTRPLELLRSSGFFSGLALHFMLGSAQVTTRRTLRRTSIKVQLRMTFMDVCCGPPFVQLAA